MSNESNRLTPNDPVSQETLQAFAHIEDAKTRVAMELLVIEQRKVQLLAAAKRIDEQHNRLFESILVDRGLPPGTQVELNAKTGALKVLSVPKEDSEAAPAPAEPPAS